MDYYGVAIFTCYGPSLEYNKTHDKKIIDELDRTLNDIGNHSILLTNAEKIDFFNLYKANLYYVAQTLRMMNKDYLIDILEKKFLYETYTAHLLDFIAITMKEFLKGITYFQGNSIDCKNLQTIDASVYNILFQKYFPTKNKLYVNEEIFVFFNPDGIPKELEILQCNPNKIIVEKYVKQINQGYNRDVLRWNDIAKLDINEIYKVYRMSYVED